MPPVARDASPEDKSDAISLAAVQAKYVATVRSFGTFAVRYREDYLRLGILRYQPPKPRPKELRTEVEWVHGPTAVLYRWKTLTPGGGDGFLRTDGKTVWAHGDRTVHEPSVPVVTTEPVTELEIWNAVYDDGTRSPWERGVLSTKEPAGFLECVGTRLQTDPDGYNPPVSLASLFRRDRRLLGKADVQGAACWHVGFHPYIDRDGSPPLGRDRRWRVEAWFDPAANWLPRKVLVRAVRSGLHDGDLHVTTTGYEVRSFVTVGTGDAAKVFPEKWVRTDHTTVTESRTNPWAGGNPQPFSETTFTLLDGVAVGSDVPADRFEPPLPADLPVIPKSEYHDWVRRHAPGKK